MPLRKSCDINPVAKAQRPAFMPCANFTLPAPSSTGSSGSAARNALLLLIVAGPMGREEAAQAWHCTRGRGRYGEGQRRHPDRVIDAQTSSDCYAGALDDMNGKPIMTRALGVGIVAALIATAPVAAEAQDYPTRAITIVVPFAPGGLTDVPVRVLSAMMQERIGQNIVIENKPGGSGTVGGAYAARAAPDGYTLFANSIADAQNLHFLPVPYNAIDDFAMIGMIVEGPPLVLVIDAALPYRSLAELLADAQAQPKKLSFGTSGPATSPAMALAQLNALAKTEIAGVPYRGSGEAARNVAGGGIQGAFAFYAQAKPLADDGKGRALAIASPRPVPTRPPAPTLG